MDVTSIPNPFYGLKAGTYQDTNETALALFDGSLDDQNDPLFPLLVKGRKVDVIIALDSSGETSNFKPNGQSLLATKIKVEMLPQGFMNFPTPFPNSPEEFVTLGLNTRPVFFGCDGASTATPTTSSRTFKFLLVWIPNNDPGNVTNFATSTLQLSTANQSVIFDHSYALASRGYVSAADSDASLAQADAQWGTCVACAAVERARARRGHRRTAACEACFARYCFMGAAMSSSVSDTGDKSSVSAQPASTGVVAGNLAANVETSTVGNGGGTVDVSTLERNSYIIMGLLGGGIVLLVGVVVMLVQSRRAQGDMRRLKKRGWRRGTIAGIGGENTETDVDSRLDTRHRR
ncbi:hypothetical protein GSI_14882 [Ganoderma sinense ZZ0214-1]|uniref:Lysophospholipase n=1 Tax=Ganoderma sinense ZZ0214-1 TaxID=1077348 RepID=A0A2G8RPY4_9APHY|nr:hypothetical protein GSI_14882 [Ganoderma sinense ZZ0214-1]